MRFSAFRSSPLVALGRLLVVALAAGIALSCGDDESKGRLGEDCRSSADCGSGLACIGSTCQTASLGLSRVRNECVTVACREPIDCCNPSDEPLCEQYQQLCDSGNTASCATADLYCCDGSEWLCESDACVASCATEADCLSQICGSQPCTACSDARCVACVSDADCFDGRCENNQCVTDQDCEADFDCGIFEACQEGVCVEVGCQTDRECVALTLDVTARCRDGECQVPCTSDFECFNDNGIVPALTACVDGLCVDVGCQTDDECRALFDRGGFGTSLDVECRPRAD